MYSAIKLLANGTQELVERSRNPSIDDYRTMLGVQDVDQYPCVYKGQEKRLVASMSDKSLFINEQATKLYKRWLETQNESPMPYANTLFIRGDAILVIQADTTVGGIDDKRQSSWNYGRRSSS